MPDLDVVAAVGTAGEASRLLRSSTIDLLLLDVQLGAHTGFQVLDGVPYSAIPCLVFVTAHQQFAVRAFDRNAVDYLLKPVREDRFRESIERVRRLLRGGLTSEVQAAVRASVGPIERAFLASREPGGARRIVAERESAWHVLECDAIRWLASDRNYVDVWVGAEARPYTVRSTLRAYAELLDPRAFVQISRSAIVNMAFVQKVERDDDVGYCFVMRGDGARLPVGRTFRSRVAALLRGPSPEAADAVDGGDGAIPVP
jgi:two-component system LytT family response regulator